ncbi:GNAT family N-acetyltransferase [Reinekea thalattae]|uniref:GNAT family N-acetyltransferase n=1 Tax=Reinekea thalattae TaxID=2593301 RepID=A0A5C8Z7D5_9GAMM|nr:GNAT family N-acetyltransferase [Reinekea thalattae]TXR53862.1 GNAT family N-acetyltransferase [Reinekea thalattae]
MVKTERLLLLKPAKADLDVISNILSSPKQTKYLPNEAPYSTKQQLDYLQKRISHWEKYNFGTFIIVLKQNPEIKLGFVGAEFAPNPSFIDVRFGIVSEHEGKGYITEATEALINWFFQNTENKVLYGVSMVENEGSKAVLRKVGMMPAENVDLYNCEGLENFSLESPYA